MTKHPPSNEKLPVNQNNKIRKLNGEIELMGCYFILQTRAKNNNTLTCGTESYLKKRGTP